VPDAPGAAHGTGMFPLLIASAPSRIRTCGLLLRRESEQLAEMSRRERAICRFCSAYAVSASLSELHSAPAAYANGDAAFSLRNFDYTRTAPLVPDPGSGQTFIDINHWRVTVCTSRPARLRIRAIVVSVDFGIQRFRFVRRQPGGCTRHRLRAENEVFPEEDTESRLRVAWRGERRRTSWLNESNPAEG
jgi:hypothetical protein